MVCQGMGILEIPMDNTPRRSHKAVEYFVIRANHISGHHRNNIAPLGKSAKGKDLLIAAVANTDFDGNDPAKPVSLLVVDRFGGSSEISNYQISFWVEQM